MGDRAGGKGIGLAASRGGLRAGATESSGMSRQLQKAVLETEARIKDNLSESLYAFDDKGRITFSAVSTPDSQYTVNFDAKAVKDKTVTHNHPRAVGKSGWESVGNSFSSNDILSMVSSGMKELRAVTPKYTFSMKRPKGGWGISKDFVEKHYWKTYNKISSNDFRYLSNYKGSDKDFNQLLSRRKATLQHRVAKQIAKDFGWVYTKKKNVIA